MHHHHTPFYDSFWSPTSPQDPIPNFSQGLNTLHQKLRQSIEENNVIATYLKQRAAVETAYAQQLAQLETQTPKPDIAFERDVGAGLKKCFEVVRAESSECEETHRQRAENLFNTSIDPLQRFSKRYERIVRQTKQRMDAVVRRFEGAACELQSTRQTYEAKCRALQAIYPDYSPPDHPVWLGQWTFTQRQVCHLLDSVEDGMDGQSILDRVVGYCQQPADFDIDEVSQRTSLGDGRSLRSSMSWAPSARFTDPDQDALKICEGLVTQGFLLPQKPSSVFRLESKYTPHYPTGHLGKPDDFSPEQYRPKQSRPSQDSSLSAIGGLWGRWGRSASASASAATTQHHNREVAIQEMNHADAAYRESVRRVDRLRMQTEEILFSHYEEMESLELERIQTIKQAFIGMAATLSNSIPRYAELYDRMMLYQETLKPDKDVEFIVEQYRTGRFCPKPFVYANFFYGTAMDQLFGVPLEEYSRLHKVVVPPLITQSLAAIEAGFEKMYREEKIKMWTKELPLEQVHEARERLNDPTRSLVYTAESLERYDVQVLASLIRLYLMELPECLITFELYDPIKQLYTNQHLDDTSRVTSISNLLCTLPSSNFYTLKALLDHFHRLVNESNDKEADEWLHNLSATFCHILVRPPVESTLNSHDRHPQRLLRDLISQYPVVFSDAAVKAHEDYCHRGAIVVAPTPEAANDDDDEAAASGKKETNTPSFPASSNSSVSSVQLLNQDEDNNAISPVAAPPRRNNTLLASFMRKSSHATLERTASMPSRIRGGGPPIPMPSKSTLFEDPDDTFSSSSSASSSARPSDDRSKSDKVLPPTPSSTITEEEEKYGTHSRMSSLGTFQGSLDSFFKDDDV